MNQACHNCRRQRLKCDRSLPQCIKCTRRGQECLGYGRLFRWEHGVASRGKMAGLTFEDMKNRSRHETQASHEHARVSPLISLTDPLVQDVNDASRKYLFYFASDVCKDFVVYDIPKHNPYRDLIPLTHHHPTLLQIIIANSALHMSNARQRSVDLEIATSPTHYSTSLLASPCSSPGAVKQPDAYSDALMAKHRALRLLKLALTSITSADIDVTLAVVLLFIEFELLDSGRDNWRHHLKGARTIIEMLCGPTISTQTTMSPLRSFLISNCLVFDILGSTLTCSITHPPNDTFSNGAMSLLKDAEGNHCSSFPTILLQLIQTGARLYQSDTSISSLTISTTLTQQAINLLSTAQAFSPAAWATDLQSRSPATDLVHRTHVASAHRAAVCIYLSRVLLSLDPNIQLVEDFESLVSEVITHLLFIHPNDPLFTATTWPTFIAGAETNDPLRQEWVVRRFQELWEIEPWGLMRGALGILRNIWARRNEIVVDDSGEEISSEWKKEAGDWVGDLRERDVDWLIL